MINPFHILYKPIFLCKLFCLIRYQSFYQTPYGKTNIYSQYNIPYLIYVIYNSRHDKKNRHRIYYKPYDSSEKHPYQYMKSPTSWYAETHSVIAHNDKSAWKANPNKMPRYFKNNTGWSICWESTIQDIFSNPFKPYIIQHKTKLTNTNHIKMKIVNVKEAKILAETSFLLPY